MNSTNNFFTKEKIIAIFSIASMFILCIQHFWGLFAESDKLQLAYIPLFITFLTICINEIDSPYERRKKIISTSGIGALLIFIFGTSCWFANGYGLIILDNVIFIKIGYLLVFLVTLILSIFQIEKLVKLREE